MKRTKFSEILRYKRQSKFGLLTGSSVSQQKKKKKMKKKRTCRIVNFVGWSKDENERKRKERPSEKTEKTMDHENDGDTNCNWWTRCSHQRIGIGPGGFGNKILSGDHLNYSITARILRRVLETWGDLLSLKLQWEIISSRWCEKLSNEYNNNNNNNNDNTNGSPNLGQKTRPYNNQ